MAGSSQAALDRSNSRTPSKEGSNSLQVDTKLVVGMVLGSMFHEDGIQQIVQMVQQAGNDAPAAAAHAIYVGIAQARHALEQQGMPVDDKVWVMKGGVLNQLVVEVGKILASTLGPQFASGQFMNAVTQAVIQIMKQQEAGAGDDESSEAPDDETSEQPQGGLVAPQGGM